MAEHRIEAHDPELLGVTLAEGVGASLTWYGGPYKTIALRLTPEHIEALDTVLAHLRRIPRGL